MEKLEKLKKEIIGVINKDGNNINELISILEWALSRAEELEKDNKN